MFRVAKPAADDLVGLLLKFRRSEIAGVRARADHEGVEVSTFI